MFRIKDDVDLKELEKFGFKLIPEGIYIRNKKYWTDGISNKHKIFITVEKDRTIKKYCVLSYLLKVYKQKEQYLFKRNIRDLHKEKHLFKKNIKDLIQAGLVKRYRRKL